MPDRDLPEHLRKRLGSELETGAPLRSPLASQARYAQAPVAASHPLRTRVLGLAAVATVALLALAFVGPQPRQWVIDSVRTVAHGVGVPLGPSSSPSPSHGHEDETPPAKGSPEATPEQESPEPSASPEAGQSPESSDSPGTSGGDHSGTPSSPEPSDGGGGTSGSDGEHSSPAPSPSPND
jgi:uncharacterized membrane protein YgcG